MNIAQGQERFFKLSSRSMIPGGWGDYGEILQHGMTAHSRRIDGKLALERTGPFIPPITFPGIGDVLLTEEARSHLASSGLKEFTFQPVEKKLIVRLRWEQWDLTTPNPPVHPEQGEPENYILGHEHCPDIAAAMGDIWELVVPKTAHVTASRPGGFRTPWECRVDSSTWNGDDIFRSAAAGGIYITEHARDFFLQHFEECVGFEECLAV